MSIYIAHPENEMQERAVKAILEALQVPYEKSDEMDETDYLLSSQTNALRLKEFLEEEKEGKGKKITIEELNNLWK